MSEISKKTIEQDEFFLPIDAKLRKKQGKEYFYRIENQIRIALDNLKTAISNDPKEQLFIDIFKNLIIKSDYDKQPNYIFLFGNKLIVQYDFINNWFFYYYANIWTLFKDKFVMAPIEIELFIRTQIKKYFKFKDIATDCSYLFNDKKNETIW